MGVKAVAIKRATRALISSLEADMRDQAGIVSENTVACMEEAKKAVEAMDPKRWDSGNDSV